MNLSDFAEKQQQIVKQYNAGASSTENYFDVVMKFTESMKQDELEIFDLLRKEKLTKAEEQKVKLAAKHLILRLLDEHPIVLVQDCWEDGQTQLKVKNAIEEVLSKDLPEIYSLIEFKERYDKIYDLVVDFSANHKKWVA